MLNFAFSFTFIPLTQIKLNANGNCSRSNTNPYAIEMMLLVFVRMKYFLQITIKCAFGMSDMGFRFHEIVIVFSTIERFVAVCINIITFHCRYLISKYRNVRTV